MNSDKLKNMVYKKAHGNSDISQKFYQLYYFERLLERISKSKYKSQIILKGGLLLTSIIGDDERTTKDMDATLKGISLNKYQVKKVFEDIFKIDINDGVSFQIISISDIRLDNEYGGFRINILCKFDNNKTYITVELTTGDVITPREIKYNYNSIFFDKKISIMSYTIETILAEKFQTIIVRGLFNTRLKDFYDIYVLVNTKMNEINKDILLKAIKNTFKKRETVINVEYFKELIDSIEEDENMNNLWQEYVLKNPYVQNIKFEDTIIAIKKINNLLLSIEIYN